MNNPRRKTNVKTPKFADAKTSVHDLTIGELNKRVAMLHTMKDVLKNALPTEKYLEVYGEIADIYLF